MIGAILAAFSVFFRSRLELLLEVLALRQPGGRPRVSEEIRNLIRQMKFEMPAGERGKYMGNC